MAKKKPKRKRKTIDDLEKSYKKFIKGKETNPNGIEIFEKTINKVDKNP